MRKTLLLFCAFAAAWALPSDAQLFDGMTDMFVALDEDLVPDSSFPGGEPGVAILDGDPMTKYLNFGQANSGFIVTPAASSLVTSFQMTAANDSPERDPISWELYGTNDPITEMVNGQGFADSWTLIDMGADTGLAADPGRLMMGAVTAVSNVDTYASYKMLFPTVRDGGTANSMQVADVAFFDDVMANVLAPGDAVIEIDSDEMGFNSSYPGGEAPQFAFDGSTSSKYLNFGAENSGVIVTRSDGAAVLVDSLRLATGNDAPERDPTTYKLYGTNDPIMSVDNEQGFGESWTLISEGATGLEAVMDRETFGDVQPVANDEFYTSYKIVFDSVRDSNGGIMQVSEIQFGGVVPEPTSAVLLLGSLLGFCTLRRR